MSGAWLGYGEVDLSVDASVALPLSELMMLARILESHLRKGFD